MQPLNFVHFALTAPLVGVTPRHKSAGMTI
jgi:hypothetical protein